MQKTFRDELIYVNGLIKKPENVDYLKNESKEFINFINLKLFNELFNINIY